MPLLVIAFQRLRAGSEMCSEHGTFNRKRSAPSRLARPPPVLSGCFPPVSCCDAHCHLCPRAFVPVSTRLVCVFPYVPNTHPPTPPHPLVDYTSDQKCTAVASPTHLPCVTHSLTFCRKRTLHRSQQHAAEGLKDPADSEDGGGGGGGGGGGAVGEYRWMNPTPSVRI